MEFSSKEYFCPVLQISLGGNYPVSEKQFVYFWSLRYPGLLDFASGQGVELPDLVAIVGLIDINNQQPASYLRLEGGHFG